MAKNKDVTIVVLAAGKGTRLKSSLAKVLHAAGGRPLIEHVVRACIGVGPKKIVVVVGHQAERVAGSGRAVRRGDGAAATAKWHGARDSGFETRHWKCEICGGAAG